MKSKEKTFHVKMDDGMWLYWEGDETPPKRCPRTGELNDARKKVMEMVDEMKCVEFTIFYDDGKP